MDYYGYHSSATYLLLFIFKTSISRCAVFTAETGRNGCDATDPNMEFGGSYC